MRNGILRIYQQGNVVYEKDIGENNFSFRADDRSENIDMAARISTEEELGHHFKSGTKMNHCEYFSGNLYLKCAINPSVDCQQCQYYSKNNQTK